MSTPLGSLGSLPMAQYHPGVASQESYQMAAAANYDFVSQNPASFSSGFQHGHFGGQNFGPNAMGFHQNSQGRLCSNRYIRIPRLLSVPLLFSDFIPPEYTKMMNEEYIKPAHENSSSSVKLSPTATHGASAALGDSYATKLSSVAAAAASSIAPQESSWSQSYPPHPGQSYGANLGPGCPSSATAAPMEYHQMQQAYSNKYWS